MALRVNVGPAAVVLEKPAYVAAPIEVETSLTVTKRTTPPLLAAFNSAARLPSVKFNEYISTVPLFTLPVVLKIPVPRNVAAESA